MSISTTRPWVYAVGIDPSLVNTRVCAMRRYYSVATGQWHTPGFAEDHVIYKVPTNKTLPSHARALQIMEGVHRAIDSFLSERAAGSRVVICCENYSFGSSQGAHQLGEVGFAVRLGVRLATEFVTGKGGAWPVLIEPKRLKKFVCNNGAASKAAILKGVDKLWGFDTTDDNDADAYGLCRIALGLAGLSADLTPYQVETLAAIRDEQGPALSAFLAVGRTI